MASRPPLPLDFASQRSFRDLGETRSPLRAGTETPLRSGYVTPDPLLSALRSRGGSSGNLLDSASMTPGMMTPSTRARYDFKRQQLLDEINAHDQKMESRALDTRLRQELFEEKLKHEEKRLEKIRARRNRFAEEAKRSEERDLHEREQEIASVRASRTASRIGSLMPSRKVSPQTSELSLLSSSNVPGTPGFYAAVGRQLANVRQESGFLSPCESTSSMFQDRGYKESEAAQQELLSFQENRRLKKLARQQAEEERRRQQEEIRKVIERELDAELERSDDEYDSARTSETRARSSVGHTQGIPMGDSESSVATIPRPASTQARISSPHASYGTPSREKITPDTHKQNSYNKVLDEKSIPSGDVVAPTTLSSTANGDRLQVTNPAQIVPLTSTNAIPAAISRKADHLRLSAFGFQTLQQRQNTPKAVPVTTALEELAKELDAEDSAVLEIADSTKNAVVVDPTPPKAVTASPQSMAKRVGPTDLVSQNEDSELVGTQGMATTDNVARASSEKAVPTKTAIPFAENDDESVAVGSTPLRAVVITEPDDLPSSVHINLYNDTDATVGDDRPRATTSPDVRKSHGYRGQEGAAGSSNSATLSENAQEYDAQLQLTRVRDASVTGLREVQRNPSLRIDIVKQETPSAEVNISRRDSSEARGDTEVSSRNGHESLSQSTKHCQKSENDAQVDSPTTALGESPAKFNLNTDESSLRASPSIQARIQAFSPNSSKQPSMSSLNQRRLSAQSGPSSSQNLTVNVQLSGATIANASVSPETPSSSQTAVASFTPTRTTLRTPEGNAATTSFALQFGGNASLKRTAAFSQHVRKATLYLIKGKRKMYLTKVPLSVDSINRGDVFILVIPRYGGTEDGEQELTGAALYLWSGSECSIVKKAKGREIAIRIQDREWNRKATLEELDDGTESQAAQKFWNTLSGGQLSHQPEAIKSAQEGGDDSEHERKIEVQMSLYGVNQNAESLYLVSKGKSLSSKIVGSGTCYVLDCFDEIYVWVGRSAKDAEKHIAAAWAEELASAPDRPEDTEVFTEKETVEGVFFMEKFVDWAESNVTLEVKRLSNIAPKDKTRYVYDRGGLDVKKTEKIDVKNMFEPPAPPVSWDRVEGEEENFGGPPNPEMDRGRLDLKVWLAQTTEGQGRVEVAKAEYGYFYSQESYLILYRHLTGREGNEKEAMIAYFWIGADCKGTEQGIAAYMAAHLDKKLQARQIRVTEGKEPAHFLRIFRENSTPMIVRRGTRAEYNHTEKILYHVKGFNEDEVRVIETAWAVSSLSSADSFVASLKDRVFVWHGAGSFAFQRSVAANAAQRLAAEADKQVQEVEELEEPKVFWQKLAGSDKKNHQYTDDYGSSVPLRTMKKNFAGVYKCRLFRVSHIIHGNPSSEEISPFVQADLDPTGVYILDAFFSIFVWVGSEARSNYKDVRLGLETALEYADYVGMQESVRNLDRTNIRLTYSGNEPPVFKSAFIAFEDGGDDITGSTGFLNKLKKRGASKKKTAKVVDESAAEILEKFNKASYSFDELKKKDNLPLGVDPTHVEAYLSENDFKKHFKIDKDTFSSYPAWKQAELKKRAGLF